MADESAMFVGKTLADRWHVVEELGRGGFGMVFGARDLRSGRHVAVKILRLTAGTDGKLEFADEARFLRHLQGCERIIDLLDSGEEMQILTASTSQGAVELPLQFPFIVLELADGCLTDLLLLDTTVFEWVERLAVFRDAVKGIHQMHIHQVVNRDLKSENMLVFSHGSSSVRGKVADLGRARLLSEPARFQTDDYVSGRGDLRFAAPELLWLQGHDTEIGWRAVDLYHLGSLLHELGTGTGLTSMVLPDVRSHLNAVARISPAERAAAYAAAIPDLADALASAIELCVAAAPSSIKGLLRGLLLQLTHPIALRRFPRTEGRPNTGASLEWLIRRVDVMSLTLRNAERQTRQLARKGVAV